MSISKDAKWKVVKPEPLSNGYFDTRFFTDLDDIFIIYMLDRELKYWLRKKAKK